MLTLQDIGAIQFALRAELRRVLTSDDEDAAEAREELRTIIREVVHEAPASVAETTTETRP